MSGDSKHIILTKLTPVEFKRFNSDSTELDLILELSNEITNFTKDFNLNINKTFFLSEMCSSSFGFTIEDNRAFLGVPEKLFSMFLRVRWFNLCYRENDAGVYLVYSSGNEEAKTICAFRIFLREARVNLLNNFKKVTLIKMKENGKSLSNYTEDEFDLYVKKINRLDWELI